jgi:hypothetical protein
MTLISDRNRYEPCTFDRVMINLIKNLSDAGWATRIIDDNNIEITRCGVSKV